MSAPIAGIIIQSLTSLAVQALSLYFELMRMAGRTPEEQEAFYQSQAQEFYENNPANLED